MPALLLPTDGPFVHRKKVHNNNYEYVDCQCSVESVSAVEFDPTIAWILGGSAVAVVILIGIFVAKRTGRAGNHPGPAHPDTLREVRFQKQRC
jgi:hypothetical protein